MISLGSLLWIVAIMMHKGGGCCGGEHDHDKTHGPNKKELEDHSQDNNKEHPRGGCCG